MRKKDLLFFKSYLICSYNLHIAPTFYFPFSIFLPPYHLTNPFLTAKKTSAVAFFTPAFSNNRIR